MASQSQVVPMCSHNGQQQAPVCKPFGDKIQNPKGKDKVFCSIKINSYFTNKPAEGRERLQ